MKQDARWLAMLSTDAYKLDHRRQYPEWTEFVQVNMTARGSRIGGLDWVVFFWLQAVIRDFLQDAFDDFFAMDADTVCEVYEEFVAGVLGPNDIGSDHIRALHDLGYLPLKISAVPEGTRVPLRIPMMLVENTDPEFFWLPNYLETALSAELWQAITSATQAARLRKLLDDAAEISSDAPEFVDFQAHDFSMRGMAGIYAAAASGAGHLLSFKGTDTLPAIAALQANYGSEEMIGGSVAATEHSVMCAGGELSELDTFARLLDLYPTGIVSVVSDTWDLWGVITEILPGLKDEIMAREGKLVIRPDSGDPVDILCGTERSAERAVTPEEKGVIQLLWEEFGGTINSKGFIDLDPHIGAIYGDSITYERAEAIISRLAAKQFASTNVVLGVGSYTYQYVTRDTFGMAVKATWVQVDGEGRDIFKDPKTDDGLKKSAKGRLAVVVNGDGDLEMIQGATQEDEDRSIIQPVWVDGQFVRTQTLDEVRLELTR